MNRVWAQRREKRRAVKPRGVGNACAGRAWAFLRGFLSAIVSGLALIAMFAAGAGLSVSAAPKPIPIILDTDIGTDIDDAFALALALHSPELDLVGVTTVSGDTPARARIAAKMLDVAGRRDVPIYAGEPGKHLPCEQCRWALGFHSPQLHDRGAVEFLDATFNRRPNELMLVTIGPLTDIAALLKKDPGVAKKIRRIVMMGGSIHRGYQPGSGPEPEYNIAADAPAAQAVFSSGIPILMVPLDVTAMLQLDQPTREWIFSRPDSLAQALRALYRLWGRETPTLFDPMAVSLLIESGLCETERLHIDVDSRGMTRAVRGQSANATVALHADRKRFFDFYLSRVAPKG
jgi:inosine-uridine nucleoside N-ribohydrolase